MPRHGYLPARANYLKYASILCILAGATDAPAGQVIHIKSEARERVRVKARKAELIEYTRHYEERMGLEQMPVDFVPYLDGGKLCGKAVFTLWTDGTFNNVSQRPSIIYSTSSECQEAYTADRIARHETCHWRLQHGYMNLSEKQMEHEVDQCMDWYRDKNSKRKVLLQLLTFLILF